MRIDLGILSGALSFKRRNEKGAEAPFDSDDVIGTSCGECEMERVEGIEPPQ